MRQSILRRRSVTFTSVDHFLIEASPHWQLTMKPPESSPPLGQVLSWRGFQNPPMKQRCLLSYREIFSICPCAGGTDETRNEWSLSMTYIDQILTVDEVATELRCSKAHVYKAINGKVAGVSRLPAIGMGRRKLIRRSTLEQWKKANECGAAGGMILTSPEVDAERRSGGNSYA